MSHILKIFLKREKVKAKIDIDKISILPGSWLIWQLTVITGGNILLSKCWCGKPQREDGMELSFHSLLRNKGDSADSFCVWPWPWSFTCAESRVGHWHRWIRKALLLFYWGWYCGKWGPEGLNKLLKVEPGSEMQAVNHSVGESHPRLLHFSMERVETGSKPGQTRGQPWDVDTVWKKHSILTEHDPKS